MDVAIVSREKEREALVVKEGAGGESEFAKMGGEEPKFATRRGSDLGDIDEVDFEKERAESGEGDDGNVGDEVAFDEFDLGGRSSNELAPSRIVDLDGQGGLAHPSQQPAVLGDCQDASVAHQSTPAQVQPLQPRTTLRQAHDRLIRHPLDVRQIKRDQLGHVPSPQHGAQRRIA
jgi:hypothetical protein